MGGQIAGILLIAYVLFITWIFRPNYRQDITYSSDDRWGRGYNPNLGKKEEK